MSTHFFAQPGISILHPHGYLCFPIIFFLIAHCNSLGYNHYITCTKLLIDALSRHTVVPFHIIVLLLSFYLVFYFFVSRSRADFPDSFIIAGCLVTSLIIPGITFPLTSSSDHGILSRDCCFSYRNLFQSVALLATAVVFKIDNRDIIKMFCVFARYFS